MPSGTDTKRKRLGADTTDEEETDEQVIGKAARGYLRPRSFLRDGRAWLLLDEQLDEVRSGDKRGKKEDWRVHDGRPLAEADPPLPPLLESKKGWPPDTFTVAYMTKTGPQRFCVRTGEWGSAAKGGKFQFDKPSQAQNYANSAEVAGIEQARRKDAAFTKALHREGYCFQTGTLSITTGSSNDGGSTQGDGAAAAEESIVRWVDQSKEQALETSGASEARDHRLLMTELVSALRSADISKAVLYMDDAAADAIHMLHGVEELVMLGPTAVVPLQRPSSSSWQRQGGWWPQKYKTFIEEFGSTNAIAQRVVVLIGGPLELQVSAIEAMLWKHSQPGCGSVRRCLVLAALHPDPLPQSAPGSSVVWRYAGSPANWPSDAKVQNHRSYVSVWPEGSSRCSVAVQPLSALARATSRCYEYFQERTARSTAEALTAEVDQDDEDLQIGLAMSKSFEVAAGVDRLASQEADNMKTAMQRSLSDDSGAARRRQAQEEAEAAANAEADKAVQQPMLDLEHPFWMHANIWATASPASGQAAAVAAAARRAGGEATDTSWQQLWDPAGRAYYHHVSTGRTQWDAAAAAGGVVAAAAAGAAGGVAGWAAGVSSHTQQQQPECHLRANIRAAPSPAAGQAAAAAAAAGREAGGEATATSWQQLWDPAGRAYYHHVGTGRTQWECPAGVQPVVAAAAGWATGVPSHTQQQQCQQQPYRQYQPPPQYLPPPHYQPPPQYQPLSQPQPPAQWDQEW
jgi:hypothetical protein